MTPTPFDWAPPPFRPYLEATIVIAQADPRLVGLIAVGSAATGSMDEFSDLDFVIVCRDEHQANVVREVTSFATRIGPLISAFTGEHVREPRLLLCLYGLPLLRVDLKFVAESDPIIGSKMDGLSGSLTVRSTRHFGEPRRCGHA